MENLSWVDYAIVLVMVAGVAIVDWRQFRIPNAFTVPFSLAGVAYHGWFSGWAGMGQSLIGLLVGFAILLIPFILGGFGGGDVKLMAAIGAWVGARSVVEIFVISAALLGVVSALMLLCSPTVRQEAWPNLKLAVKQMLFLGKLEKSEEQVLDAVKREDRKSRAVPFGVMVVGGIMIKMLIDNYPSAGL
jgi:Flp pilus assembly protein protease CpaA